MEKSILTIVLVLIQLALLAQYSDIELIEKYNHVGKSIFKFKTGVTTQNTYYHDLSTQILAANSGNGTAYVLESLLRMYETTKDKAYLYEFIRHALELQHYRGNCGALLMRNGSFCFNAATTSKSKFLTLVGIPI